MNDKQDVTMYRISCGIYDAITHQVLKRQRSFYCKEGKLPAIFLPANATFEMNGGRAYLDNEPITGNYKGVHNLILKKFNWERSDTIKHKVADEIDALLAKYDLTIDLMMQSTGDKSETANNLHFNRRQTPEYLYDIEKYTVEVVIRIEKCSPKIIHNEK